MVVLSRCATGRLGTFSVLFVALLVAAFMVLDSPQWMLVGAVVTLVFALLRVARFMVWPPWQVRWNGDQGPVEVRSLTGLVRRSSNIPQRELQAVGPVVPYGTNHWDGAELASRIGRQIGMYEIALHANGSTYRVIGCRADLVSPAVERLRRRVG